MTWKTTPPERFRSSSQQAPGAGGFSAEHRLAGGRNQVGRHTAASAVTAGVGFGLTLEAKDIFGNVDTAYSGPVTVSLAGDAGGTLSGTTTLMTTGGVAHFTDLSARRLAHLAQRHQRFVAGNVDRHGSC